MSALFLQPTVVIVPHHNIVASIRHKLLSQIKSQRPITKRIIIIGPDHFGNNQKAISYDDSNWNLQEGTLVSDLDMILKISPGLSSNNNLVKNDHAVYNLLPDIKKLWPDALITPILIGQKVNADYLKSLITNINNSCGSDCLLIASVDFSHYLPASLARVHDQKSIRVLNNNQTDEIYSLEVDSPQSLFIAAVIAKQKQSQFILFNHTNSGFMDHNPDTETTTHLFAYYQPQLFPSKKINSTTFTYLPTVFTQVNNQTTVGDRFFYGVDEFKVQTSIPDINQSLPVDFIVSGYRQDKQLTVSYHPVNISGKTINFDRGESKASRIKKLFDQIDCSDCHKDYLWSTITYELN